MPSKGTALQRLRCDPELWGAAMAAFPAERGRRGGLTAELVGYVEFLAEDPDRWRAVKTAAAGRGIEPWQLVAEALEEHLTQ